MDLKQLECFVAVAEELSFRRAAERLSMSQSAVSNRISTLEYTTGITLEASIDMYIAYRKNGNSPTTNKFISASKEVALHP